MEIDTVHHIVHMEGVAAAVAATGAAGGRLLGVLPRGEQKQSNTQGSDDVAYHLCPEVT